MSAARFRNFPLDGKLLRFDRTSGENQLWSGEETARFRQRAPRVLQVAITNRCNKECSFCYRPLEAKSTWSYGELVAFAKFANEWGVLELAFGGGEPTLFPRFAELLRVIWNETSLCTNFTTNGSRLTPEFLAELKGHYGQIQLSIYDEDDYLGVIDTLARERARFGLNYLVTPGRLATLEVDVLDFCERGVVDILLLSYKGRERELHLSPKEQARFDEAVARLHRILGRRVALKVDVCWGDRLHETPRLFEDGDCGAGALFMSITSDKKALACSFSDDGVAFSSNEELPGIWREFRDRKPAAKKMGCARLPHFGSAGELTSIRKRVES